MTARHATGLCVAALLAASASSVAQPQEAPSIVVSRQLAAERGLNVGSSISLSSDADGRNVGIFVVAGIYEPVPDPTRLGRVPREVRLHLPDLLALTRDANTIEGTEPVEQINVALVDPADAEAFARDVNRQMPGVLAQPSAQANGAASLFRVLERFHLAIALVTIVAATVFLLALTIMLVDERRATVGVLRLIGLPVSRILTQVLVEGLLIAAVGTVFGLVLAFASESVINRFFQWRYDTALVFVRVTPKVAALCAAIAVPLGAVATVVASWALLRRGALRLARR